MAEEKLALPIELLGSVERYAVYRCYTDQGQLLYVGETGDLGKRLADHAKKLWFVQVRGITLEWYADELDALKAERRAIHVEHPKYNVQHRDLKTLSAPRKRKRKRVDHSGSTGRPRSGRDKAIALIEQYPNMAGPAIAQKAGVSLSTVDRARREMRAVGA